MSHFLLSCVPTHQRIASRIERHPLVLFAFRADSRVRSFTACRDLL
jgi:hypothetical protein